MNRIKIIGALLGLFFLSFNATAQTDEAEIKKTIMLMFDGMRAGDSAMVHAAFAKQVTMQRVAKNREGKVVVSTSDLGGFLKAVGTPHDKVWNEQITFESIQIDGEMASVWTPFKFYLGDTFSHCGVNVFKLYKSEDGWKIFHLVDTNRRTDCG